MRPRPSFKIDFEDGSSATLCLVDPGSSVAVRDKNHAVEYLGLDPGLLFARERPCPHRLVDVGDGPRHSNRWTCAFLRPSSSLKADHVATLVHPDSLSLSNPDSLSLSNPDSLSLSSVGSAMGGALVLETNGADPADSTQAG